LKFYILITPKIKIPKSKNQMFRYQNSFAVLDNNAKRNKIAQSNKKRYRRRMEAFPPLTEKKICVPATDLNYKDLIPNLNEWTLKSKRLDSFDNLSTYDQSHYHSTSSDDEDSDNRKFNQVWCVEKDKPIVFESDMYSDSDVDSFIYEPGYDSN